ncbi:MAG: hypothetical protein Q9195_009020 [Heterodermia aff. obscurata]
MDPIGLGLAAFATVDLCMKYGQRLRAFYNDYKHREDEIHGMMLAVESSFLKTEWQLQTVRKIWNSLDQRLQDHFANLLQHLENKLQNAVSKLEKFLETDARDSSTTTAGVHSHKSSGIKLRYVFCKDSMRKTIEDLKRWQEEFDPSWYLMTLIANPVIDRGLQDMQDTHDSPTHQLQKIRNTLSKTSPSTSTSERPTIFLDPRSLGNERYSISPSSQAILTSYSSNNTQVIIDTVSYSPDTETELAVSHVRDLARVLAANDPSTSGLLTCQGVIKRPARRSSTTPSWSPTPSLSFDFVFEVPTCLHTPKLLRDLLVSRVPHPLDERFDLAKSLARSIMFVHTSGFVHKNVRPDTIIVFNSGTLSLGKPYLIGFERFRPLASGTNRQGDTLWERNLYRHPRRQGVCPEDYYKMQHDIYSLGICLLEIGLWTSFVIPDDFGFQPGPALSINQALSMKDKVKAAFDIKRQLTDMALTALPLSMGTRYANLVVACLTCLDPDETNRFGKKEDLQDEDGVVVGIQYIEKVVT